MENENQDFIEAETSPSLRSNDINRTRNYKYRPQIKNQNTGILVTISMAEKLMR